MMYSVTDVQGLNSISAQVLANGANALGRHGRRPASTARDVEARDRVADLPASRHHHVRRDDARRAADRGRICATITNAWSSTPPASAAARWRSWSIPACWRRSSIVTTTEVCDLLMGGVFPATDDRFGAIIRTRVPLCRLGRRARHGQFRRARHDARALPRAASCTFTIRRSR